MIPFQVSDRMKIPRERPPPLPATGTSRAHADGASAYRKILAAFVARHYRVSVVLEVEVSQQRNQAFLNQQLALTGESALTDPPSLLDLEDALSPGRPISHLDRARELVRNGQFDLAKEALVRTIATSPRSPDAPALLGALYLVTGEAADALPHLTRAADLQPTWAEVRRLCGEAAWRAGQNELAATYLQSALALKPLWPEVATRLGEIKLRLGDYQDGWCYYESRWDIESYHRPNVSLPLWAGTQPLFGKTIIVFSEGGLNELFQFVRYADLLRKRGGRVIVTCPSDLCGLIETVPGVAGAVGFGAPLPPADFHVPLMSLPWMFGTTLGTIPVERKYMKADEGLCEEWRSRFATLDPLGTKRIGILWTGYPGENLPPERSVPFAQLHSLWSVPNVTWFSLAIGQATNDLRARETPVIDLSPHLTSADHFAAAVNELDGVVAVDTAVAHIAGALGKPAYVLLNNCCHFRWLGTSGQSPWYPSLQLFRQEKQGDWSVPISRLLRTLGGKEEAINPFAFSAGS